MSMLSAVLAMVLAVSYGIEPPTASVPQSATAAGQTATIPDPTVTTLEDIVVKGRPLSEATSEFVDRIAAPPSGRGAATWRGQVCIGVGNLQRDAAVYVIDRISDVAEGVGLDAGQAGCEPRVFIMFATDADGAARDLVEAKGRRFRMGISGADRGQRAVAAFESSDRPVRWWQSSAPVNRDTGVIVARLPGSAPFAPPPQGLTRPSDLGPQGMTTSASRLRSPLADDLSQVIIIVDVDQVIGVDLAKLSDYLAMVALAQIDPDVDTGPYDSILSLFAHPETAPAGLTDWDRAYLQGLYGAEQTAENPRARLAAVADTMAHRVREQQRAAQ